MKGPVQLVLSFRKQHTATWAPCAQACVICIQAVLAEWEKERERALVILTPHPCVLLTLKPRHVISPSWIVCFAVHLIQPQPFCLSRDSVFLSQIVTDEKCMMTQM